MQPAAAALKPPESPPHHQQQLLLLLFLFLLTALIFCLRSNTSLQYSTGAAHITFFVKQPAATAGSSATTSDRSAFLPDARRAAYTPVHSTAAAAAATQKQLQAA